MRVEYGVAPSAGCAAVRRGRPITGSTQAERGPRIILLMYQKDVGVYHKKLHLEKHTTSPNSYRLRGSADWIEDSDTRAAPARKRLPKT